MKAKRPNDEIVERLETLRDELARWKVDYVSKIVVKKIDDCLYYETSREEVNDD